MALIGERLKRLSALERTRSSQSAQLREMMGARAAAAKARAASESHRERLLEMARVISEVEARLKASRETLDARRHVLEARRAQLDAAVDSLPDGGPAPMDSRAQPAEHAAASAPPEALETLRQSVQLRRAAMLLQLTQIFVIRVSSDGRSGKTYTINHLRPVPLAESAGSDDEENAAALGLVAHFVAAIARILLVQLQHPPLVCSSRSHVLDRSVLSSPARLPLYAKGAEPAAYRRAQALLAHGVQQLLDAVGIAPSAGSSAQATEQLLPNLEVLMSRVRKAPLGIRPW
jgi:hypothetical protein